MTIAAVIHEAEEGGFWAEVPSLPGCVSQGETLEEVSAGIREAVLGWLEVTQDLAREKAALDAVGGAHRPARVVELAI